MNNNESPLSIKEQIEVLEAAKLALVSFSFLGSCPGLCYTIERVICDKHSHLHELVSFGGVRKVIPSFTFENAVLHGTVSDDAVPYWLWWSTKIEKGGIAKRLAFLDFLIDNLKNEDHE